MSFDFNALLNRLDRLLGRRLGVFYLGLLSDDRVPLHPDAYASGLKIRWVGRLTDVRCIPTQAECRPFSLRPRRILLVFERGIRVAIEVEQVVGFRPRAAGLQLLLRQGRSLFLLPGAKREV